MIWQPHHSNTSSSMVTLTKAISCTRILLSKYRPIWIVLVSDPWGLLWLHLNFDHSKGHDCLSPDALSPTQIRKEFGGKQPFMRLSVIENELFLGPYFHHNKLQVSNTEIMTFQESDEDSFYLNKREREREERQFDKIFGNKKCK